MIGDVQLRSRVELSLFAMSQASFQVRSCLLVSLECDSKTASLVCMHLVLRLKPVPFRGTFLIEHLKVDLFVFYGVLQMLRSPRLRSSWSVEREVGVAGNPNVV